MPIHIVKASVTTKHYAAYNLEIDLEGTDPHVWCGPDCTLPNDRHSFNAVVSARDLAETYLPAFRRTVQAGAGAVMCSYNAINGEPSCTNRALIAGTLRESFGFNGIVATDCGALSDATHHHHRYATDADTAGAAIIAGVDSNCGSVFTKVNAIVFAMFSLVCLASCALSRGLTRGCLQISNSQRM